MLPLGQHLALSAPWWSWDSATVRKALWASVLTRLRCRGNERLKANGAAGRSPASWRDLEFLRREVKTQQRVFNGKTNLCLELLLGYAGVLGIDAQACFPDTEGWIAEAAVYLTLYGDGHQVAADPACARVYVTHVARWTASGSPTGRWIEQALEALPAPEREAVLSVSGALGPVLERCDPEAKLAVRRNGA